MKKLFVLILFYLIVCIQPEGGEMASSNQVEHIVPPGPNDVIIAPNVIVVPLGKILIIRKNLEYGAVKFTKFWTGKTEEDRYAEYESYYQGDKTGNLSNKNVQLNKEKLAAPKPRGIGRFAFSFGNRNIQCGPIRLQWSGKGSVYFYSEGQKQGDYGIELAPTIWTDISQVNVFDPRIKWYKYDEKRPRQTISIDKLWETEKENKSNKK